LKNVHLYLLVFPKRGMMKVGKADDFHKRILTLRRYWGDVDYAESYSLAAPANLVFRLEKALMVLLSEHALTLDVGDGRTEFFAAAALERALQHIELFAPNRIVKGIRRPAPVLKPSRPEVPRDIRYYWKKRAASRDMVGTAVRTARQFDRINRWLLILLRRQDRIAYQYSIDDNEVTFRIRSDKVLGIAARLLMFPFRDLTGNTIMSMLNGAVYDGVTEFSVRMPVSQPRAAHMRPDLMLAYFADQSVRLLKQLPNRSAAAQEEIPAVDRNALMREAADEMQEAWDDGAPAYVRGALLQRKDFDTSG